ncbi:MAG: biotin--[acetyl-CoA-carboxylase] ligase [Rhodospirillales bacterium]
MTDRGGELPPGYRLLRYDSLDSTMSEAERLALAGAGDGTLVLADRQTAGRGRRGRVWNTPEGNLALSALLRPQVALGRAALIGFAAGLALHDSLAPLLKRPERLRLKWPNDLLLDGAKLAGLLLESRCDAEGRLQWLIVGLGVNLTWAPDDTPYPAAALRNSVVDLPPPERLATDWALAFARWRASFMAAGFAPLRGAWKARAAGLGGPLTARLADGTVLEGRFEDIAEDGSLLLDIAGEARARQITAAEVYFRQGEPHAAGH